MCSLRSCCRDTKVRSTQRLKWSTGPGLGAFEAKKPGDLVSSRVRTQQTAVARFLKKLPFPAFFSFHSLVTTSWQRQNLIAPKEAIHHSKRRFQLNERIYFFAKKIVGYFSLKKEINVFSSIGVREREPILFLICWFISSFNLTSS